MTNTTDGLGQALDAHAVQASAQSAPDLRNGSHPGGSGQPTV
ncbi:hypothetical protein [Alicyclobacillus herbarius]|nr:hypothetical protein [Alicyclobacillus herbarius]